MIEGIIGCSSTDHTQREREREVEGVMVVVARKEMRKRRSI
jgi:hypothetical protein